MDNKEYRCPDCGQRVNAVFTTSVLTDAFCLNCEKEIDIKAVVITREFEQKKDIVIKQMDNGCFDVHYDGKHTEQLAYDEMLGVITQLTMPENKRCLSWLKTPKEHEEEKARFTPTN